MPTTRPILCVTAALAFWASGCFIIIEDGDVDASTDGEGAAMDTAMSDVGGADTMDVSDTPDSSTDASDMSDADDASTDAAGPDACVEPSTRAAIAGVDLSGAIFLGRPARAAADRPIVPTPVTSFQDYRDRFSFDADGTGRADGSVDAGAFVASGDNALAWSVSLFFANGGSDATVVPTAGDVPTEAELAALPALDGGLLVVPGLAAAGEQQRRDGLERIEVALNAAGNEDVFFVGNPPVDATTADLTAATPPPYVGFRDDRAALYVPWLEVASAADTSTTVDVPPAGAVAGVYARIDATRGIWKSPAGRGADIRGIQGLSQTVPDADLDTWNQAQVNPLRLAEGEPVVWGARTRQADNSDWRYVATRRLASHIEESIRQGTTWAAYEPNDETLWAKLAADAEYFLDGLWRRGALQGATAADAYFVRVDRTTTTDADIAAGRADILLGFAPLRPQEFIILRISVPTGVCQ